MATSGKFNQYDKPWGPKLYGTKSSATYENTGCAPTAISNIIYAWNKKITPLKVGNYLKSIGGRTAGGATYKAAVPKTIKHFGGKPTEYSVAFNLFKKLYDDKCKGIDSYGLMDVTGTRGGVTWTTGGHYVSIRDIEKNGDNDFLLRIEDPGWRKHDGYYSYRTNLQGCIKWCWYVTSDKLNKSTTTSTTTKTTATTTSTTSQTTTTKTVAEIAQEVMDNKWGVGADRKAKLEAAGYNYSEVQKAVNELVAAKSVSSTPKADKIVAEQKALAWAYKTKKADTVKSPKKAYTTALRAVFTKWKSYSTNYKTGKTCDEYVAVVMRHSGVDKSFPRHRGESWSEKNSQMLYLTQGVKSGKYKLVSKNDVQNGDIILQTRDAKGKKGHICLVYDVKNKLISEASAGDFYPRITKSLSSRLETIGKGVTRVYRVVE